MGYHNGYGVRMDKSEYLKWCERAAKGGSPEAMYNLGMSRLQGDDGMSPDKAEVRYWWTLAADGGDPRAMYNLGVMYSSADGVERNPEEANKWFSRASVSGHLRHPFVR